MIAADILAALPVLRAEAEALMLDTGKALRPTGTTYDPAADGGNGATVTTYDDLFASKCKVNTRNLVAREAEVGGRTSTSIRMELHLPAGSDPLRENDVWEFTAVHPLSLTTVGQRLRVVGPVAGTLKTAARYEVEAVVS